MADTALTDAAVKFGFAEQYEVGMSLEAGPEDSWTTSKGVISDDAVDVAAVVAALPEVAAVIFAAVEVEADAQRGSVGQAASVTGSLEVTAVKAAAIVLAAADVSAQH